MDVSVLADFAKHWFFVSRHTEFEIKHLIHVQSKLSQLINCNRGNENHIMELKLMFDMFNMRMLS